MAFTIYYSSAVIGQWDTLTLLTSMLVSCIFKIYFDV